MWPFVFLTLKVDSRCGGIEIIGEGEDVSGVRVRETLEWRGGGKMQGWQGHGSGWLRQSGGKGHNQGRMSFIISRAGQQSQC